MTIAWNSDDYLRDECEEDAIEHKRVWCPYCGTTFENMEAFEDHSHGTRLTPDGRIIDDNDIPF